MSTKKETAGQEVTVKLPANASVEQILKPAIEWGIPMPVEVTWSDLPSYDQPVAVYKGRFPSYMWYNGFLYTSVGEGYATKWFPAKGIDGPTLIRIFQELVLRRWNVGVTMASTLLEWAEALVYKLVDRYNQQPQDEEQLNVHDLAGIWYLSPHAVLSINNEMETSILTLRNNGRYVAAAEDSLHYNPIMAGLLKWFTQHMNPLEGK